MEIHFGLAVGILATVVGFASMLWNETLVARHHLTLDVHHPKIVKISDCSVVDPSLNGSLVYIQGRLDVPIPIRQDDYKLAVHAVKLKRRVQMYQWVELQKDRSDYLLAPLEDESATVFDDSFLSSDDVTYVKEWRDQVVNFTGKHASALDGIISNPSFIPITNAIFEADVVKVGAYVLSKYFVENYFNTYKEITGDERPDDPNVKLHAGLYYHTSNIWEPQVGDVRLRFAFAGNGGLMRGGGARVSIVALLLENTLHPYEDEHGRQVAILHEDWDPLATVIAIEKVERSRPLARARVIAILTFAFGVTVILVQLEKMSLSALFTFFLLSLGVCWLLHWPLHAAGLIIVAVISYYTFLSFAATNERLPLRVEKRRDQPQQAQ